LVEPGPNVRPKPSVNSFFYSIAAERGEDVIGVILSGTGSDGAGGVRAIKAGGGLVFAQDPGSAKYAGMPQSAIETDCVDWVLPPGRDRPGDLPDRADPGAGGSAREIA
jgi:two-component system CheB/CheR fusion protein